MLHSVPPPELSTGDDLAMVALITSRAIIGMCVAEVEAAEGAAQGESFEIGERGGRSQHVWLQSRYQHV